METEAWFFHVHPRDAAKYGLDSDGPSWIPVLRGTTLCSTGVWERDRSTASQVGQAHWHDGMIPLDAVFELCKFVCASERIEEFYVWDDHEGGYWCWRCEVWPSEDDPEHPNGIWREISNNDYPWLPEELA